MPSDEDLLYEEELLRNPYNLKMWWRYIQARTDAPAKRRYLLYERALRALPGSYKVRVMRRCMACVACMCMLQPCAFQASGFISLRPMHLMHNAQTPCT